MWRSPSASMSHDRAFVRQPNGDPLINRSLGVPPGERDVRLLPGGAGGSGGHPVGPG